MGQSTEIHQPEHIYLCYKGNTAMRYVLAIHKDAARCRIVKAAEKPDHGGLATTRRSHDGRFLSGWNIKGHGREDRALLRVPEVHILEAHVATINSDERCLWSYLAHCELLCKV